VNSILISFFLKCFPHGQDKNKSIYLSRGGLPSEEVVVERTVRRVKLGLEEDAAIGYGLQRGGAFVGEAKPNEQLDKKNKKEEVIMSRSTELPISRSTHTFFKDHKSVSDVPTLAFLRSCCSSC